MVNLYTRSCLIKDELVMNKSKTKKILFSLVAILIVFAMGLFKEQINGDRTFHKCTMEHCIASQNTLRENQ